MGEFSTGTTQQTKDFLEQQRIEQDPSELTVKSVQAIAPPRFQDSRQPITHEISPTSGFGIFDPGRPRTPSEELERLSGPLIRAAEAEERPMSRQTVLEKSMALKEGLAPIGGMASLELGETLYHATDIADFFSGVANMATGGYYAEYIGRKKGHLKELDKLREKYKKEGDDPWWAYFKATGKMFSDAPEFPEPSEFVQSVIKAVADVDVTTREADELTAYFKPEATKTEQVIRAIPELYGFSVVGVKIVTRFTKKTLKQMQELYDVYRKEKKLGTRDIGKINNDEFGELLHKFVTKRMHDSLIPSFLRPFKGLEYTSRARRAQTIVDLKRIPVNHKRINKLIASAEAKKLVARTAKDKDAIALQIKKIAQLQSGKMGHIPFEVRSVLVTELGSQFGGIVAGNFLGQEYSWIGYLAGGLTSGIGTHKLLRMGEATGDYFSNHYARLSGQVAKLSDEQAEALISQGKIPKLEGVGKEDAKALEQFAGFIKSLPPQQRRQVYSELKFLREVQKDLSENYGISEELLNVTVGKAMGLMPLMMIRESMAAVRLDVSKGLKPLGKEVEQVIEAENFTKKQLEEFGKLLKRLANQAENAGFSNKKFTAFTNAMKNMSTDMEQIIKISSSEMDTLVNSVVASLKNPRISQHYDGLKTIEGLIQNVIKHKFLKLGPEDRMSLFVASEIGEKTREIAREILNRASKEVETDETLLGNLSKLYRTDEFLGKELQEAGANISGQMNIKYSASTEEGGMRFENLKGLIDPNTGEIARIDISQWLRGLYAEDVTSSVYDTIINKLRKSRLSARLAKTRLANSSTLEAFSNVTAKESINTALKQSTQLRKEILEAIQEYNKRHIQSEPEKIIGLRFDEDGNIIPLDIDDLDNIDHRVVMDFYNDVLATHLVREDKRSLSDFDLWKILDDEVQRINQTRKTNLIPDLTIEVGLEDIHKISSSFNDQARSLYSSNRGQSLKYSKLSEKLVESVDPEKYGDELAGQITEAKDFWTKSVHNVWNNAEANPLGYRIHNTKPMASYEKDGTRRDFINNPASWIDLDSVMAGGDDGARELIRQLKMTFGTWDKNAIDPITGETGTYVLDDPLSIKYVKNMLNALLIKRMSKKPEVALLAREAQTIEATPRQLGDETIGQALEKQEAFKQLQRKKVLKPLETADVELDPALQRLNNEGLLDIQNVADYNRDLKRYVEEMEGPHGLRAREEDLATRVDSHRDSMKGAINNQEKGLIELVKTSDITATAKADQYKELYEFFVTSPRAFERIQNFDKIIGDFAKKLNVPEVEAKKILSDIVIEGLSQSTKKGVKPSLVPGEMVDEFDWDTFAAEVTRNEDILRTIAGEEAFTGIKRMSQFMQIATRSSADRLSDLGVSVVIPRGLSVESYVSRVYAISRGIISPKYVATEVALLQIRKKNANLLAKILQDPKAVDAVIDLIERGGEVSSRTHAKILTTILTTLANLPKDKEENNLDSQMNILGW